MRIGCALAMAMILAACGQARPAAKPLSREFVGAAASAVPIAITSAAVGPGGRIKPRNSAYGADLSPQIAWSPVAGAKAWALIMEDTDAAGPKPWSHWLIWNIPGDLSGLAEGVPKGRHPSHPVGALQGRNDADVVGYFGPRPPSGVHHYHFEIFALDAPLSVPGGADRADLLTGLRGHVLAVGELVATYEAPRR